MRSSRDSTRLTLTYVVLLCDDVATMRRFYEVVLGLRLRRDWLSWVELDAGRTIVALRPRDRAYDGEAARGAGVQLAFEVGKEEVEAWHEHLKRLGVPILEEPTSHAGGHRTLFVGDPEGNVVEIYAELGGAPDSPAAA